MTMTNHPNRKRSQSWMIVTADGVMRGPFAHERAARLALAEWTGPRSAARDVFAGASIEKFTKMTAIEMQEFGAQLNSARIEK